MPAPRTITPDQLAEARRLIEDEGLSQAAAAKRIGASQSGLSVALRRDGDAPARRASHPDAPDRERPGLFHGRDGARIVGEPAKGVQLGDIAALIRSYGLDPDEWVVTKSVVNQWGRDPETGEPYGQLKAWLSRRAELDVLRPAAHVPTVKRRAPRRPRKGPRLGVILSDPHNPYVDLDLDRCVEQFLREVEPDVGVMNGDIGDYPTISRHKRNPAYDAPPRECIQASYGWTRGKVEASPSTEWYMVPGNHDARLRDYQLAHSPESYGLAPAAIDGEEVPPEGLGDIMRRVLHLDRLGVQMVAPDRDGEYVHAEVRLAERLGVRHGAGTAKDHARKGLERRGYCYIHGHDHRQASTYLTRWDHDGHKQLVAVGAGCLCIVTEDGLGYMTEPPDWHQGFATVALWPDGRFHIEHAVYTAGSLTWRDRRWDA